jgi:hypothetical protein
MLKSPVSQQFKISILDVCCGLAVLSYVSISTAATPTNQGQSGYVNMPNAYVEPDGTFSVGYGYDSPYGALWVTTTPAPFLQVTGRYVSITGIPGFTRVAGEYGSNYGRYKDKVVDAKLQLLQESQFVPAVSLGATDLLGTGLFKGQYLVASKTFGEYRNVEVTLGYGNRRPDGAFAGLRWGPVQMPGWALVAEYDANDYAKDFRASETEAGRRTKGPAVGLEYRWR